MNTCSCARHSPTNISRFAQELHCVRWPTPTWKLWQMSNHCTSNPVVFGWGSLIPHHHNENWMTKHRRHFKFATLGFYAIFLVDVCSDMDSSPSNGGRYGLDLYGRFGWCSHLPRWFINLVPIPNITRRSADTMARTGWWHAETHSMGTSCPVRIILLHWSSSSSNSWANRVPTGYGQQCSRRCLCERSHYDPCPCSSVDTIFQVHAAIPGISTHHPHPWPFERFGWWTASVKGTSIHTTGFGCTDDSPWMGLLRASGVEITQTGQKWPSHVDVHLREKGLLQSADWVPPSIRFWGVLTPAGRLSIGLVLLELPTSFCRPQHTPVFG